MKRLDDEFYDLLALALIEAAEEYDPQKIRDPKGFVIFKLKRALYHYYEYVYALKRKSFQTRMQLLEFVDYTSPSSDFTREIETRMFLDDLFAADWLSDLEKFYIRCLANDIYPTEIAERTNENFFTTRARIKQMREKIRDFYYKGVIPKKEYIPSYMDYVYCPKCQNASLWQKGVETTKHGDNIKFECRACHKQFHVPVNILFDQHKTSKFLSCYKIYKRPTYMDYFSCPHCHSYKVMARGTKATQSGTQIKKFMCGSCGKHISIPLSDLSSPDLLNSYLKKNYPV